MGLCIIYSSLTRRSAIASLIYRAIAFSSTFQLRITAKIRFETAIASLIYQAIAFSSTFQLRITTKIRFSTAAATPVVDIAFLFDQAIALFEY
ncbi:hypothetical protein [Nostoc sp.]|uniref:hypothetical protein n=1 Tax=Nostoc sp. TaxID=1180 RepID=UPI002FFC0F91